MNKGYKGTLDTQKYRHTGRVLPHTCEAIFARALSVHGDPHGPNPIHYFPIRKRLILCLKLRSKCENEVVKKSSRFFRNVERNYLQHSAEGSIFILSKLAGEHGSPNVIRAPESRGRLSGAESRLLSTPSPTLRSAMCEAGAFKAYPATSSQVSCQRGQRFVRKYVTGSSGGICNAPVPGESI